MYKHTSIKRTKWIYLLRVQCATHSHQTSKRTNKKSFSIISTTKCIPLKNVFIVAFYCYACSFVRSFSSSTQFRVLCAPTTQQINWQCIGKLLLSSLSLLSFRVRMLKGKMNEISFYEISLSSAHFFFSLPAWIKGWNSNMPANKSVQQKYLSSMNELLKSCKVCLNCNIATTTGTWCSFLLHTMR